MDFDFCEEHRILKRTVHKFAGKEAADPAEKAEEQGFFPREIFVTAAPLGFLGTPYPPTYEGCGPDMISTCLVIEGISKVSASLGLGFMIQTSVGTAPIYYFGSEYLKTQYLVPAIRGEKVSAFALTEPGSGSDAGSIQCRAKRNGGSYHLDGTKMFVSNSYVSDFLIAAVRTNPRAEGKQGLSLLLVDRQRSPYDVHPLRKLGLHGLDTSEVVFEQCRVPIGNLLGEEGEGFEYLKRILTESRILTGASALGVAKSAFDIAVKYASERIQFGRKLSEFQTIRHKAADMCIEIEMAECLVYKSACLFNQGRKCDREASISKVFASEAANRTASESLQILGGYGYMREYLVERYFRDARAMMIFEGTSEIQRSIIAKSIFKT